jgi:DDE superfamily endonuclease
VKKDRFGNIVSESSWQFPIKAGTWNIFSVTDCTTYEICRPGSGPNSDEDGSPRNENWYVRQRAFYDGYHRGMEACLKVLTIVLPNGLYGAIYGPTSGRDNDIELFRLSQLDNVMSDLCVTHHGGDLYCTYGDAIFAGYWECLRTAHFAPPGMHLTGAQEEENENMKAVRECVEWSYAKAEGLWKLLTTKYHSKLEVDSGRVFAEIRVMFFLTNCKVCVLEGSTMTGSRGFRTIPPTLEEYLSMRQ